MYRLSSIARVMGILCTGYLLGTLLTSLPQIYTNESDPNPPIVPREIVRRSPPVVNVRQPIMVSSREAVTEKPQNFKVKMNADAYVDAKENDQTVIKDMLQKLTTVTSELAAAHRLINSGDARNRISASYDILQEVISKFNPKLKTQLPEPYTTNEEKKDIPVCPEVYKGSTFGYPFFYKGFEIANCTNAQPFKNVITILLNFHAGANISSIDRILTNINRFYKDIPVLIATDGSFNLNVFSSMKVLVFKQPKPSGGIWNDLVNMAKTEFVFVARDLDYFDWNARLDRLVREVVYLGAPLAGSSTRTEDGHWSMSCQQVAYRNYTLTFRAGYDISKHECVYCNLVSGPFVALQSTMKENALAAELNDPIVFEDFFMKLRARRLMSVVCPDAMNYVKDISQKQNAREKWLPLARKYKLNHINLATGVLHEFSCDEIEYACPAPKGEASSPCCLQYLSDSIKFFMRTCEQENMLCELQEGTLLGAVKFNKVLPWERDADLTISSANYTAFKKLTKKFSDGGYSLQDLGGTWCCADGRMAGGKFNVGVRNWHIEVYGQHIMDTEKLANVSMAPTKVFFDGMWVNTPRNPALYVRNRYSPEIFRHAQHWMVTGASSGWAFYKPSKFSACPHRGSHTCLDQFIADGNLQFEVPMP